MASSTYPSKILEINWQSEGFFERVLRSRYFQQFHVIRDDVNFEGKRPHKYYRFNHFWNLMA